MSQHDVTATIDQLFIHPIKSCAGVAVSEAKLLPTGLQHDRQWVVTDPDGKFVTQRKLHRMALIHPSVVENTLVIKAQGMTDLRLPVLTSTDAPTSQMVTVWGSSIQAWDMGDQAATWFSEFLGQPLRLRQFDDQYIRPCNPDWTGENTASTLFSDGYPLLITSTAGLDELNERLQQQGFDSVDQRRFRPNIVLGGIYAHDEDQMDRLFHAATDEVVELKLVKPCDRCPIPSIDPDTALYQPEAVGDTLVSYRKDDRVNGNVTFGMNAIILQGAGQILKVGDVMGANYAF